MATPMLDEAALFHAARQIDSPEARRRYLQEACGANRTLRARIEALLRVHEEERSFLETPAILPAVTPPLREGPGTEVGPYRLLEQIGEGGFGVVYLAEQQQPVRRPVAMKILKPGMDTQQVVARFEQERQALALMDHPHIARVFDAGETASGRPYFVMELVKGVPITRYCDEQRLTPRERLSLFVQVCQAVQHAHQKSVIHRDIKPSNVLVAVYDGKPVPKLIDFGVAKALGQQLTERTLVTGLGTLVGTLEYMSPEQAKFDAIDIDTRTDIYSLGVLLYELLTGTTPLTHARIKQAGVVEALRLIREEQPPRPSTRLSESKESPAPISTRWQIEPGRFARDVRGDLDWIVMKALEKDCNRRYDTADGLARDIGRYLDDGLVEARPPSTRYRLGKFARKHRKFLLAAAAFLMLMMTATAVSVWLAVWATVAEQAASQQKDRAEAETRRAGRNLYAARMNLAQNAWEEARIGRLVQLLDLYAPVPDGEDLRGFEWYHWHRLADSPYLTLGGHTHQVLHVAFSPDGRRVATASMDQTVRLWDAADGRELRVLRDPRDRILGAALSPDGGRLALANSDEMVHVWDLVSGRELLTLRGHSGWVTDVAFSPDGEILASASYDQTVRLWHVRSGKPLSTLKGHRGLVRCVAFSPDGRRLASGGADGTIKLWDIEADRPPLTWTAHSGPVNSLTFSPVGKFLASAGLDRDVKIWNTVDGKVFRTLRRHREEVFCLRYSPDGRRLASASKDRTINVWTDHGRELQTLKGHAGYVLSVAFSPDGQRLASAGDDRTIKLWDVAAGQEPATVLEAAARGTGAAALSPDGTRLAAGNAGRTVTVWDLAGGCPALHPGPAAGPAEAVAFSPDGRWLATAGLEHRLTILDMAQGRQFRTVPGPSPWIRSVAFRPDGRRLAIASVNRGLLVWDLDGAQEPLDLPGHTGAVNAVAYSPDGRWLASAGDDLAVRLWDAADGHLTLTLRGHTARVLAVAFRPDGRQLASGGADDLVRLWDPDDGQELLALAGHTAAVTAVAYSPDGKRLASGSVDTTVKLWDVASGQETLTLKANESPVGSVAFSPDGLRLAAASRDRQVYVWDARPWTPDLRREQAARNRIRAFLARGTPKAEAVRQIEQDATLPADVRQEALDITRRWHDAPQ